MYETIFRIGDITKMCNEKKFKVEIDEEARKVRTKKDLKKLLKRLTKEKLDYGTAVWAVCAGMKATFNFLNEGINLTGFQVGFVAWDMLFEYMLHGNKTGARVVDYDNLLYPQNGYKFEKVISRETFEAVQKEAVRLLKEVPAERVNPKVKEHWEKIVNGELPFGFELEKDEYQKI